MNQAALQRPDPQPRRRFRVRLRSARAGGRYTRFVAWMRITLPVVAGVLILLVVIWPQIEDDARTFRLMEPGALSVTDGGDQQVVNARFTGLDDENRPFTVIADSATQTQANPDEVTLAFPKADVTLEDGAWIALSGEEGRYSRSRETLNLNGDVTLFHDSGFEIRTAEALIDFATNIAVGEKPVQGHGPSGTLSASGFRVLDGGKRIWFAGPSRMVFWPKADGAGR